jgi:hypothetical protein
LYTLPKLKYWVSSMHQNVIYCAFHLPANPPAWMVPPMLSPNFLRSGGVPCRVQCVERVGMSERDDAGAKGRRYSSQQAVQFGVDRVDDGTFGRFVLPRPDCGGCAGNSNTSANDE